MEASEKDIADHPFWGGLQLEQLPLLKEVAEIIRFDAGLVLFRDGEKADRFCLIRNGKVALEMGIPGKGKIVVQTLGEGDALGFSWLYPPYEWHFDARTLEETEVIQFDAEKIRKLGQDEPELGRELALRVGHVVLDRLHATRLQLMDFYGTNQ